MAVRGFRTIRISFKGSPVSVYASARIADALAEIEKEVILSTLDRFKGHRVRTAGALGIGVRTLGMKLKRWKEDGVVAENA